MNHQIASTDKYDVFKEHGEQPPMKPAHMKRLMRSMMKNGFVPAKAIHVYRDGKFLRIIDGHNRFCVARQLGIPVYYVIGDKTEASLIDDLNSAARVWSNADFLNMYVQRNHPDYITLQKYINKGIPITIASSMLFGEMPGSNNAIRLVRDGAFKVKTTKLIDKLVGTVEKMAKHNSIVRNCLFLEAIGIMLTIPGFDPEVLIDRVSVNPRMLERCATRDQAFDLLEEIYNFRARERINIAFQAKEVMRERRANALKRKDA